MRAAGRPMLLLLCAALLASGGDAQAVTGENRENRWIVKASLQQRVVCVHLAGPAGSRLRYARTHAAAINKGATQLGFYPPWQCMDANQVMMLQPEAPASAVVPCCPSTLNPSCASCGLSTNQAAWSAASPQPPTYRPPGCDAVPWRTARWLEEQHTQDLHRRRHQ
jgi:hypothetical protein